ANNERDDQGSRGDLKFLRADQRHDGPFKTNHAADEGIDKNEKRELRPVGTQAKAGARRALGGGHSAARRPELSARTCAARGGAGGMASSIARKNVGSSSIRNALL